MFTYRVCCTVQNLCINEEVRRLGSIQQINDRCMEMQKNKHGETLSHISRCTREGVCGLCHLCFCLTEKQHQEDGAKRKRGPAKSTCPYYKAPALQHMRDEILGAVQDMEQLLKLGSKTRSCPYYSTRLAIPPAQVTTSSPAPLHHCATPSPHDFLRFKSEYYQFITILHCLSVWCPQLVVLPYQMLLHEATRRAAGVQLKEQVQIMTSSFSLCALSPAHTATWKIQL